jgi:heme exporter protein D
MKSLDAFLNMGGYAGFVWPAYGITAFGILAALIVTWRGLKAREREFETLKRERQ